MSLIIEYNQATTDLMKAFQQRGVLTLQDCREVWCRGRKTVFEADMALVLRRLVKGGLVFQEAPDQYTWRGMNSKLDRALAAPDGDTPLALTLNRSTS